jgi:thioredoxin 1
MVTVVSSAEDMKILIDCECLVVVDFFATWCGPCKAIAPKIEEMAKGEFSDVKFLKVDVTPSSKKVMDYNITAMPTFKFIKGGKEVDELVGANAEKLKEKINKNK